MKTILYQVREDDNLVSGLENAMAIARAFGGHLRCVHAVPSAAYVSGDLFGGVMLSEMIDALDEAGTALRAEVGAQLDTEDVSWDYEHVVGQVVPDLVRRAALCDLVVATRPTPRVKKTTSPADGLAHLVMHASAPVFVPGDAIVDPAGTAVIGWNGSFEAANAVRAALPLLRMASAVEVVRVREKERDFPDTHLLEYLSRHDIHANLTVEPFDQESAGAVIQGFAEGAGASLLVVGGYGRSRFAEWLLGGVTRSLLSESRTGLLLMH